MKKSIKFLSLLMALGMTFGIASGCVGGGDSTGGSSGGSQGGSQSGSQGGSSDSSSVYEPGTFDYEQELLSDAADVTEGYNSNLFYVNTLEFQIADPTVIYVEEGDQAGYFYAYGTSDEINCHGFQAWRSKDLSRWECMGVAYQPDYATTWSAVNYWAPEIIYDNGIYYLFYNAQSQTNNKLYLSVAYSTKPQGPFISPDGRRDADGNMLSKSKPLFDFTTENPAIASLANSTTGLVRDQAIDASPFLDPVSGKKYMYFSYYNSYSEGSFVYGVEMKDWFTPDYSTLTMISAPGFLSVNGYKNNISSEKTNREPGMDETGVNEGPFMVYHDGKYYMTMSIYGYTDPQYKVIQAIGSGPLADDFRKVKAEDGGKVVSSDVGNWSHIVSAGHHCFIRCGEETLIAYHTFKDRNSISGGRALAVDKVVWIENSKGQKVMHTNGPTWSVQPLPESVSGYKNIAPSATVTADKTDEYSDVSLLTDEVIKYQEFDLAEEYTATEGTSTITLSWNDYKTVRGLMIYNSYDYYNTFVDVDSVEMEYLKADGSSDKVVIKDLQFDWDWHFEPDYEFMRPGGAAIAEFAELPVKKITIKVSSASDAEYLALGEIVVLGKDTACAGVGEWEDYSYVNAPVGSPHIEKDSLTFGDVAGTSLETWWGYDLTHDDGTADAYIEQTGSHDQYAYFKDVNSTNFYVEAEFTVTKANSFAGDLFPKFGIAMTTTQDYNNTIFFYVDAANNYTKKTVGCAQRKLDNTDWDWDSTEQLVDIPSINYTNGGYVKLGVLRIGNEFYMVCNGQLAIYYDSFSIFNDVRAAACGFLSFNTGMKIKNYYATADAAVIAEKEAQYAYSLKGENFGTAGGFRTTTGWDLTTDRGETPTVVQSQTGEQYAYFAGVSSTKFTAELDITVTKDLGDPYPKFGMVLRNSTSRLFFYIDGAGNYTAQNVGYHLVVGENFRWQDAAYNQEQATSVGSYTDGETVTLKIVRDGATVQLYVDGNLVFTLTDLEGFGASDACAVGAFSFTTGVTISNYSCAQN